MTSKKDNLYPIYYKKPLLISNIRALLLYKIVYTYTKKKHTHTQHSKTNSIFAQNLKYYTHTLTIMKLYTVLTSLF